MEIRQLVVLVTLGLGMALVGCGSEGTIDDFETMELEDGDSSIVDQLKANPCYTIYYDQSCDWGGLCYENGYHSMYRQYSFGCLCIGGSGDGAC
ncbi:MAG: hypothetical protein A2289_14695 [Deltaproteobacteria bacterium RIFOXYA12_FULL_58_15]|nr:MAG: hypothetical protein A2289_14695 [Deltaproteobacteria bacterium RIFOXYA12_FULL_58_15]OGR07851.1 MAG: hypothetical protein A2341_07250 [Deltaproteobacteria bacterium RIFOXYB12_FULL_58_9]